MKKRFTILLGLLLSISMILAACGTKNTDEGSSNKAKTPAKKVDQVLHVNINTEPFSLNPGLANDSTSGAVLRQTFEGLTRIDKDGKVENAMAESVEKSDDLKTYTFKIRDDAKWSNGDDVTADDFVYAWKWALDPAHESQYAYQLYYVKGAEAANTGKGSLDDVGVKAQDAKTLVVELANPTPYFLELTSFYTYFPVDKKIAEANDKWYTDAGDNYVSNGPFVMKEWSHKDKIVLEKSPNYWDKDSVKLDSIEMYMINDPNTELQMYNNDELDWAGMPTGNLPTDVMKQLQDSGKLNVKAIAGTYWYKFNTEKAPFNNVNIRKAFAYAINRQAIVDNITQGGQIPAMAAVPPSMFPDNEKGYFKDNDTAKAKEFLAQGLKELGLKKLPAVTLSYNTSEAHGKIAQAIQDMWKNTLGVDVKLENEEWGVYIEKLHQGNYEIGRMGWLGDFNDPINFLELFKDKKGGNNDTNWENPEFKKLLNESATEADPAKRTELLKQAEQVFMDDMPVAPIYFYTNTWLQKDNLKDVVVSGLGDVQYKWAYFK